MSNADEAQLLLRNPVFIQAIEAFKASTIEEMMTADPTDKERCQALVIRLQQTERLCSAIQSIADDEKIAVHNETMAKAIP